MCIQQEGLHIFTSGQPKVRDPMGISSGVGADPPRRFEAVSGSGRAHTRSCDTSLSAVIEFSTNA